MFLTPGTYSATVHLFLQQTCTFPREYTVSYLSYNTTMLSPLPDNLLTKASVVLVRKNYSKRRKQLLMLFKQGSFCSIKVQKRRYD